MSQWNLSVRLDARGSSLGRTLRQDAQSARALTRDIAAVRREIRALRAEAARRIDLNVRINANNSGTQTTQRSINQLGRTATTTRAQLGRMSGQSRTTARDLRRLADEATRVARQLQRVDRDIQVRINLDDGNIARRSAATAAALNSVRDAAQDTARALLSLAARARITARQLDDLTDSARRSNTALRSLDRRAQSLDGRLSSLSTRTRTLRSDMDDLDGAVTRVSGRLGGLRGNIGTLNQAANRSSGGTRRLMMAAVGLATALIPIGASLAPIAAGLGAAGAGTIAYGLAIASQVAQIAEASDAQKKYNDAVREHGRGSQEAAKAQLAQQQILSEMTPETREAAAALGVLKDEYRDWSDELSGDTMPVVTKSLQLFTAALPKASPMVRDMSDELEHLLDVAAGGMQTPGFDRFVDKLDDTASGALARMTSGLVNFTQAMDTGQINSDVEEFFDFAHEVGPEVADTLSSIARACLHLLVAASDMGVSVLSAVDTVADLINAIPEEALSTFIQAYAALKLLSLGIGLVGSAASAGAVARLAAYFAVMRAAGVGTTLRATAASMTRTQKAAVGLGVLAIAAIGIDRLADSARGAPPDVDRLTTSLKNLSRTGEFTGELKKTFGSVDGLVKKFKQLEQSTKDQEEYVDSFGKHGVGALDDLRRSAYELFDDFRSGEDSLSALEDDFKGLDEALATMASSGYADQAAADFKTMETALKEAGYSTKEISEVFPEYTDAVAALKAEQDLAAQGMGVFGQQAIATKGKLDAQKASADGLRASIVALNDVNRAAGSAMSAFEQSIDDATKAAKDHAGVLKMRDGELDLGSDKARDAEKVLSALAANTDAAATAAREQGKSWKYVNGIYDEGRDTFIKAADDMGLTREQAELLADSYLKIPDKKSTLLEMRTEDAVAGLDAVIKKIEETPNAKSVKVDALTSDAVTLLESLGFKVTELPDGRFEVSAETGSAQGKLDNLKETRDGIQDKTFTLNAETLDTIEDLQTVQDKVASTKGKTITMKAPTAGAREQLELLGFKIRDTKGKNVVITAPTGTPQANVTALAGAINSLQNRDITITTRHVTINETVSSTSSSLADALRKQAKNARNNADGGVFDYYADGGIQRGGVRHFASGSEDHVAQIARGGSWRVWAEDETQGEGYVPFARSKRVRSRAITEEIVRRLGGDPAAIDWNADGSVTDWRYDPQTGSLYSSSDAGSAGRKTKKVKIKGKVKEIEYFDVGAVERKLKSASKATQAWNKDLERVADRVGGDVAEALAAMGEDGVKLADKMAKGSTKYINQMAKALRDLQKTAKASLTDYTRQLDKANKLDKDFAANLAKLAGQGYGDLASQLAEQNDQAAMDLAAAAVKDKGKASKANKAAKTANNALTADQVSQLVAVIAAITTSKTGIHDVAAKTGLGEDDIIDVATKATSQIKTALGSRAGRFLADLAKAQKGMAYENGGIRAGMYATQAGIIRFAEPSTHGEAYVPFAPSKRGAATAVLSNVASRFGLGLTDAGAGRVVVVREQGPLVGSQVYNVTSGGSAEETARKVEDRSGYQLRRLARGGVGARS
ncbi:hypothetical protein [Streptomyces caniscabiei]|uniref:hypothetical protein n=1 Tax=Streptomyces caniscabiei TaxID=2746961 RepID=UPI001872A703|nr:hypothetical protein [Streptomyces caniscabiei]MBE4761749.1 hypothetical protein [Streptomyces caniscabiei]